MVMEQVWPQPFITTPTFQLETSGLLQSAEVQSVSPLTVAYVINPAATWSDGVPITAADFVYAWHEHLAHSASLPNAGLVAGYRDIASIVGSKGGRTVTVTFTQPYSAWQSLFADLTPAHIAERDGWTSAFQGFSPSRVVSGGPFEITSYVPGRDLVLSRNPHYWGPPARVAHIRFVVVHSSAAVVAGVQGGHISVGEVDASSSPPGTWGDGLVGAKPVTTTPGSTVSGVSVPRTVSWSGFLTDHLWQLCFNLADPTTAERALRLGVEHALDRSEIVADSIDLVDPRVPAAISRFTLVGESYGGNGAAPQRAPALYDPAASLADFRSAGYLPAPDGRLRLNGSGTPLRLTLLEPSGQWAVDQAGLVIEAELRAVGVSVTIEKESLTTMLSTRLPEGRYQLALAPFAVSQSAVAMAPLYTDPVLPTALTPDQGAVATAWSTADPPGTEPGATATGTVTRDVLGLDDPVVTGLFASAMGELNPPQGLTDLEKLDTRMWGEADTIPLFQSAYDLVRSVRVDNVSESPTAAGIMWDAQDWAILKQPASNRQ